MIKNTALVSILKDSITKGRLIKVFSSKGIKYLITVSLLYYITKCYKITKRCKVGTCKICQSQMRLNCQPPILYLQCSCNSQLC